MPRNFVHTIRRHISRVLCVQNSFIFILNIWPSGAWPNTSTNTSFVLLGPPPSMPHKQRLISIQQTYSRDLKHCVIYQSTILLQSMTEIAINLDMLVQVVQRVLQTWKENGDVCRDQRGCGWPPLLGREATKVCTSHCPSNVSTSSTVHDCPPFEHIPDLYLDEIQEQLLLLHDCDVSLDTISLTLHRLGYSSKKVWFIDLSYC